MATLHTLFDADASELHDLIADPSTLVSVQTLIIEILNSCSDVRALGIHNEIVTKYGAFALPGIISATYVAKNDTKIINKIANRITAILCALAKDNIAAERMILRNGVLSNPFSHTHAIYIEALTELGYTLTDTDYEYALTMLNKAEQTNDIARIQSLYQLLLPTKRITKRAINQAKTWFSEHHTKPAAQLTNTLLHSAPQDSETIVRSIITQQYDENAVAYTDVRNEITLASAEAGLQALSVTSNYLQTKGQRHKLIESFYQGAIAKWLTQHDALLAEAHNIIINSRSEIVYRYWWQAINNAVTNPKIVDYCTHALVQFCTTDPEFAEWGIVQLMFLEKRQGTWVTKLLEDISRDYIDLYNDADATCQRLFSTPKRQRQQSVQINPTGVTRADDSGGQ
jgi:hypothetical protein